MTPPLAKERIYRWVVAGTFDPAKGCRHPLDVIAVANGCTVRTAIRAVQQLEAEGRMRVDRPRRRGQCNTYHADCWNPTRRSDVLNKIKAGWPAVTKLREDRWLAEALRVKRRREGRCHPKRTALTPHMGSNPCLNPPSLGRGQFQRELVASASNHRTESRKERCVDALVCNRCQPLEDRVAELEAEKLDLIAENSKLGGEFAGLQHTVRKQGSEIVGLRNELRRVREGEKGAEEITAVLEAWKRLLGHPKAKTPLDGKRAKLVRAALKSHEKAELMLALEGLALKPYVGAKGRTTFGTDRQRFDDIEYALGDETRIAKCIGFAVAARQAVQDRHGAMLGLWLRVAAQERLLGSLVASAVSRGGPVVELVQGSGWQPSEVAA